MKICCLIKRQNGEYLASVKMEENGKPDFHTATLITTNSLPGEDGSLAAERAFKAVSSLVVEYAIKIHNTEDTEYYTMSVSEPRSYNREKHGEVAWVKPWYLVNGPTGSLAKEVFDELNIYVSKPDRLNLQINQSWVK